MVATKFDDVIDETREGLTKQTEDNIARSGSKF